MDRTGFESDLLWSIFALRVGGVTADELAAAWNVPVDRGVERLDAVMARLGTIDTSRRQRIDGSVRDHLMRHGRNIQASLGDVGAHDELAPLLSRLADPALRLALGQALGLESPTHGATSLDHSAATAPGTTFASVPPPPSPPPITIHHEGPINDRTTGLVPAAPAVPDQTRTSGPIPPGATVAEADLPTATFRTEPAVTVFHDAGSPASGDRRRGGDASAGQNAPGLLRFQTIRHHAKGGLGTVYLARDGELHRDVALKEIQSHADRPENRARFLLEAEVTGGLEHPGIVPVYGLGRYADGRPYYAMRFIHGESLKDALLKFHRDGAGPRPPGERALALRKLLTHFVDVCETIAYAHSRGVLHRDLKPGNIMIGRYGETLVVDWGLAKPLGRCIHDHDILPEQARWIELDPSAATVQDVAEPTSPPPEDRDGEESVLPPWERPLIPSSLGLGSHTREGTAMGTPQYMSPEQAQGDMERLGPASDIYSLGATLYDVVVGRPPFHGGNARTVIANVIAGTFPRPRSVNPAVPPALEAIVLKAMAREPGSRYVTVKALGADLERWLADEPVSAYPDPWSARLARWARRHRTATLTTAGVLVSSVLGLSVGAVLLERERARTEQARRIAQENFQLAYDAADKMLGEVGDVELADIPQMEPVRRRLLELARARLAVLVTQSSNDPEVRLLEARGRTRLCDVLEMMGDYAEAEPRYREVIATLEELARLAPDDSRIQHELGRAHHGFGVLLRKANRFREAEPQFRRAIALRTGEVDAPGQVDPAARRALIDSRYQLGILLDRLSDPSAEDQALYRQAVADQETLVAEAGDEPEARTRLFRMLNNLARLEAKTNPAGAARDYRSILDHIARLDVASAALPGSRWQEARARNNLAALALDDPDHAASARGLLEQSRDALDRLQAEFPRVPQYRRELAAVLINLGLLAHARGDAGGAAADLAQAVDQFRRLDAEHPAIPDYTQGLANALFQQSLALQATDEGAATAARDEARALQDRLLANHPEVADYAIEAGRNVYVLAKALHERGVSGQARPLIDRAIQLHEAAAHLAPGSARVATYLDEDRTLRLLVLLDLGDHAAAAEAAEGLAKSQGGAPDADLRAAAALARCAELANSDPALDGETRTKRREAYGRRAVLRLREAVESGRLVDPAPFRLPEFVPLHGRDDFRELLQGLLQPRGPRQG